MPKPKKQAKTRRSRRRTPNRRPRQGQKAARLNPEEEQTTLSLERTIMGKEKVVLNEMTVLLALLGFGFLLIKFFEGGNPFAYWSGALFIFAALVGIVLSARNYQEYKRKLSRVEQKSGIDFE